MLYQSPLLIVVVLAWLLFSIVGSFSPKCQTTPNVALVTGFTEPAHEQKRRNELKGNLMRQLLSIVGILNISQWPLSYDVQVRAYTYVNSMIHVS